MTEVLELMFALHQPALGSRTLVLAILLAAMAWWSTPVWCRPGGLGVRETQEAHPGPSRTSLSEESLLSSIYQASAKDQNEKVHGYVGQLLAIRHLDANTLLRVGIYVAQQGFYSDAASIFAQCARDYPALFEAHYNLALAELALKRYRAALTAIETSPPSGESDEVARRYLRGKIEAALNQTNLAGHDLAAAFKAEPQQENYALEYGLFCLHQRHYTRATRIFRRAADFNPRSSFLLLGLSLAEFREGRDAACIQTCQKLLTIAPQFSPARLLMAFVLYTDGKLPDSEKIAVEGLKILRSDPYLYYLDVTDLLKLHSTDYPRMLNELTVAERGIPECSLCLVAESKVQQRQGNVEAAAAALEHAVKIDPTYSDAWYRLALLYERTGNAAAARKARARFSALKAVKEAREEETLRRFFMKALAGPEASGMSR